MNKIQRIQIIPIMKHNTLLKSSVWVDGLKLYKVSWQLQIPFSHCLAKLLKAGKRIWDLLSVLVLDTQATSGFSSADYLSCCGCIMNASFPIDSTGYNYRLPCIRISLLVLNGSRQSFWCTASWCQWPLTCVNKTLIQTAIRLINWLDMLLECFPMTHNTYFNYSNHSNTAWALQRMYGQLLKGSNHQPENRTMLVYESGIWSTD